MHHIFFDNLVLSKYGVPATDSKTVLTESPLSLVTFQSIYSKAIPSATTTSIMTGE